MNKMGFLAALIVTMFAVSGPFLTSGCNETQLRQADRIVTDANSVVTAVGGVMQSPAGALLPPGFQLYGTAAIAIASIIVNAWQQVRGNLMKKTTKAIVKGIEFGEKETKPNPTSPIKVAIRQEMIMAGIYDRGNQLVDQLKVSR